MNAFLITFKVDKFTIHARKTLKNTWILIKLKYLILDHPLKSQCWTARKAGQVNQRSRDSNARHNLVEGSRVQIPPSPLFFEEGFQWRMLKAPPVNPWTYISQYYNIDPAEGR